MSLTRNGKKEDELQFFIKFFPCVWDKLPKSYYGLLSIQDRHFCHNFTGVLTLKQNLPGIAPLISLWQVIWLIEFCLNLLVKKRKKADTLFSKRDLNTRVILEFEMLCWQTRSYD